MVFSTNLCRTNGFAKLACDAPFLAWGVPPEGVLATEPGAQRSLLEWIVDGGWLLKDVRQRHAEAANQLCPEHGVGGSVGDVREGHVAFLRSHDFVAASLLLRQQGRAPQSWDSWGMIKKLALIGQRSREQPAGCERLTRIAIILKDSLAARNERPKAVNWANLPVLWRLHILSAAIFCYNHPCRPSLGWELIIG